MRKHKCFFKYCDKCDKKFKPTWKTVKICDECWQQRMNTRKKVR